MSERGSHKNPLPSPPPSLTGEGRGGGGARAGGEINEDCIEQVGHGARLDADIALGLAVASFILYLRTLAPGVVDADGGEFQFAAWNFSFVHPTGYPLYLILGGLVQHLLPVGDPAYRLNLFTALTAALAVATLYLAAKEFTHRRWAAAVAALSFAVTRTFWFDAGAAEVYDLNAFFLALLIFLALRWQALPRARTFGVFCFVYGLALTHHRTMILWAPAFVLFFIVAELQARGTRSPSDSPLVRGRETPSGSALPRGRETPSGSALPRGRETPSGSRLVTGVETPSASPLVRGRETFGGIADRVHGGWTRLALPAVVLFLLPFLLYLYVPLRAPSSPYAVLSLSPNRSLVLYDNSINGFLNYVFGRAFQFEIGWDATSAARLGMLLQRSLEQFGIIGIALGIVGLGVMTARKEWARLVMLLAGAVATALFASLYHIGDISHYYIPAYLVWAVWVGVGIAGLADALERPRTEDRRPRATFWGLQAFVVVIVGVALVGFQFAANLGPADRSHETQAREQWDKILAEPIPANAILLSNDRDEMMPLWYIQYVENRRRDLLGLFPLITRAPEHANVVRLIDSVWDVNRPLYLIKPMPGLEIKYRLGGAQDTLLRIEGRATDAAPAFASNAVLGERVRVIGYDVARQAQSLKVAIYWQAFDRLEYNYTTFLHLVDERGQKAAQGSDHQVGGEFYPTTMWQSGEVLRDEQTVVLPAGLPPQVYRLVVGMYRQAGIEPLGEPAEIGTIDLR